MPRALIAQLLLYRRTADIVDSSITRQCNRRTQYDYQFFINSIDYNIPLIILGMSCFPFF